MLVCVDITELETGSTTSSQMHMLDSLATTAQAGRTAGEAEDMIERLENRKKSK